MKAASLVTWSLCFTACAPAALEPEPQLVLFVDTDGTVPNAVGRTNGEAQAALFDTLRFDILPPGAAEPCPGCTREFAVTTAMFENGDASIGLFDVRDGTRLRVRLFSDRYRLDGEPYPDSTLDAFVALPASSEGVNELVVRLPTMRVGQPLGSLDDPIDPMPGPLGVSEIGTFVQRSDCSSTPSEHEVCVPGGAFWMGNPRVLDTAVFDSVAGVQTRVNRQRLVVLSPFFLDKREMTVGRFTAAGVPNEVPTWSGDGTGDDVEDYYTLGGPDGELPLNGVTWQEARERCLAMGRDLPTEAQFEYVASDLRSADYPWGAAVPTCDDAAWGRGGIGPFAQATSTCSVVYVWVPSARPLGPQPVGRGDRDDVAASNEDFFNGDQIVDVAGNLGEWVRDDYAEQGSACWPNGVVVDPLCVDDSHPQWRPVRGGRWTERPNGLMAAVRSPEVATRRSASIGFRCARPGG